MVSSFMMEPGGRASFGYVVNQINKSFPNRKVTVCFESCFAASAYKLTIRGANKYSDKECKNFNISEQYIEDCKDVPTYPIYGVGNVYGDGFSSIGNVMYLQYRYHIRRWWIDLTEFDPKGKNKALGYREKDTFEDMSPTTENIMHFWLFFSSFIP